MQPSTQQSRSRKRATPYGALAGACRVAANATGHEWPSPRWRNDPVGFARDVLGLKLWAKQVEILNGVRDHQRVTVRSGHKCGKSTTLAVVALWFYCSFDDARVTMTSVTSRQVDAILWREVKRLHARARIPIGGELGVLARTGLRDGFREVVGFTAKEAEAVAGVSGANLLYLVDEASGVADPIFEAIEGNRAGGARLVLASNPTRLEGEFFRSHNAERSGYYRVAVSSEESPNVVEGRAVVPGLAERAWVEEKRREWGAESLKFRVRVLGEFPTAEEGRILSLHDLTYSELRWSETPATGALEIGLDPAGPGLQGDETALAGRRGLRMVGLRARAGLDEEAIIAELVDFADQHRVSPGERVIVRVDREGEIGARVFGRLQAWAASEPTYQIVGVRGSSKAPTKPLEFDLLRDEAWASLRDWIKAGGAIVEDAKLSEELHAPEWEAAGLGTRSAILRATDKKRLRRKLGRSPDRADALALAVWTGLVYEIPEARPALAPELERDAYADVDGLDVDRVFDPYGGRS